ncbi:transposase [Bradyrhizobium sp. Pa8]
MVLLLARVVGVGLETADMLVQEILSRPLRDRRAVARYARLTGSPDQSGARRREKGLAKSGNARVRRGLIQLAWRFLMFQKGSALARWYRCRTEAAVPARRKTMIAALARKLLIDCWRLVTIGSVPEGVILRTAGRRVQQRRSKSLGNRRKCGGCRSRSEMAVTRGTPWLQRRGKNVPAASEPRTRSEWLLHGPGPLRT